jgi:hypothetical protein
MNIKNISIVLTILLVAMAILVFAQSHHYESSARETYDARTKDAFGFVKQRLDQNLNPSNETYKLVWALACEGIQTAKSSQDMAKLEAKYFPTTKGANNKAKILRHFEATSLFFIDSHFDKVETDKKSDVWFLNKLKSIDVGALLGAPQAEEEEVEGEEEEEVEEEVEEAPAKPAKAAKGKKGKKGKKR